MKIGKCKIPKELEPIVESGLQLGVRFIDTTDAVVLHNGMEADDFQEDLCAVAERARYLAQCNLHTGRFEAIYSIPGYTLCEHLGIPKEEAEGLGEQLDGLELVIACPPGKEKEFHMDGDNALLIFFPDNPQ